MSEPPPASADAQREPPDHPHHHFLVQAPVPPLDADGLRVVTLGTAIFAVASVLMILLYPRLVAEGREWWLSVCLSGFGLGLIGLVYCRNRVRQRRR